MCVKMRDDAGLLLFLLNTRFGTTDPNSDRKSTRHSSRKLNSPCSEALEPRQAMRLGLALLGWLLQFLLRSARGARYVRSACSSMCFPGCGVKVGRHTTVERSAPHTLYTSIRYSRWHASGLPHDGKERGAEEFRSYAGGDRTWLQRMFL